MLQITNENNTLFRFDKMRDNNILIKIGLKLAGIASSEEIYQQRKDEVKKEDEAAEKDKKEKEDIKEKKEEIINTKIKTDNIIIFKIMLIICIFFKHSYHVFWNFIIFFFRHMTQNF